MLKIKDISKSYNAQLILKNISLDIQINKIIGLAGPSGGGKSTLLRCIQKLEQVDSGEIICTETTGFMFQDFQLFPHMTVLQNLTYAPTLHNMSDVDEQALLLLKRLNMTERANFYPAQLSGGQKQRVALARLLMMRPTLLLCDEPTSGLDIGSIAEVISLLKAIKQEMNITMIIASHDLEFLSQVASRIILLKNGGIVLDVDIDENSEGVNQLKQSY